MCISVKLVYVGLDPMDLELWLVVIHHVGVGN